MNQSNTGKGILFAALGSIGWGISGVCSQYLFTRYAIEADWLTAIRMLFSGMTLLLFSVFRERKIPFSIWKLRKDRIQLLAFSFLGLLMCQYTFLKAIACSNSATATVLQSLNVVIMAIVTALWQKKPMEKQQVAAVMLALGGTFLIASHGDWMRMKLSAAGLVFGLLAAAGVVIYTLLSRSLVSAFGNTAVTGWGMFLGGLILSGGIRAWKIPSTLDGTAWLILAVIILIGTAFAFSAFLEGVKYIGPVKATLIGCLEPVSATILSALLLGTQFTPAELVGFGMIILTVFLSVKGKKS